MEDYKATEHLILKTSHIVGQYYKFLKKTNVLNDIQILHTIFLIILLPHCDNKKSLFEEIKLWYDLSSKGQFIFNEKTIEFNHDDNEIELKNNLFLFTITVQIIVKLLNVAKVANNSVFLNYLQEKEVKQLIYESLQEGIMGINNELSLTQYKLKENTINFFSVNVNAIEVYNVKNLFNITLDEQISSDKNNDQTVLIDNLDDLVDTGSKGELKEKYQICALCSGSIHNNHSNKYEYLNLINEGKTLYRKTDLFATGLEENFKNNHYICIDCVIERFAPIQLLIDDGLITEKTIKNIDNKDMVFEIDRLILKNNIIKFMPYTHEERIKLLSI